MGFVSTNGLIKFYFKLPRNNFPSSQVKAKTCPGVKCLSAKWVIRALERWEGLGTSPGQSALRVSPLLPRESPQPVAQLSPVLEAPPVWSPVQTQRVGLGFLVSCLEPSGFTFGLSLGVCFLLSKSAPPWVSGCDHGSPCGPVQGSPPHWVAPCSPDWVSGPLSAPDSCLAAQTLSKNPSGFMNPHDKLLVCTRHYC